MSTLLKSIAENVGYAAGIVAGAAIIGSAMRWIWKRGRTLERVYDQIDALPETVAATVRAELADHEARWHGRPPDPVAVPTWVVPQPNGDRPRGDVPRHRR